MKELFMKKESLKNLLNSTNEGNDEDKIEAICRDLSGVADEISYIFFLFKTNKFGLARPKLSCV